MYSYFLTFILIQSGHLIIYGVLENSSENACKYVHSEHFLEFLLILICGYILTLKLL